MRKFVDPSGLFERLFRVSRVEQLDPGTVNTLISQKSFGTPRAIARGLTWFALGVCSAALIAPSARAAYHLWSLREVYTDSSGNLQFIELSSPFGGQQFVGGQQMSIANVVAYARGLNGADWTQLQLHWPSEQEAFDLPWAHHPGVLSMTMDSIVGRDHIVPLTQAQILEIYTRGDGEKRDLEDDLALLVRDLQTRGDDVGGKLGGARGHFFLGTYVMRSLASMITSLRASHTGRF